MMQGTIEQAQPSKSGKTLRIKVGDTWYSTDNWALQQAMGRQVQFDVGTSDFRGNTIYFANNAELVTDVAAPEHPAPQAGRPAVAPSAPAANELTARDFMPFTSNQVAHAIQAGLIKEPTDIMRWAQYAFEAIKAVTSPVQSTASPTPEFDDDIPF